MARAWLKIEGGVGRHAKVRKLADLYGVDPYLIVGFLIAWWDYCAEYGSRGEAAKCPSSVLRELALPVQKAATKLQIPDMETALRKVRLCGRDGRPHDWQDYAGALLTRRAKEAQRKRLARALSAGHPADANRTSTTQSRGRGEEKKTVKSREGKQPERMTKESLRAAFEPAA